MRKNKWLAAAVAATLIFGIFSNALIADDTDGPEYTITIDDSIEHGEISVDMQTAAEGVFVEVNVTPDVCYNTDTLTYTTSDGKTYEASGQDDYFCFSMPASDVTISATFKLINIVNVDFGAGHEDFVEKYFSDVPGFTVDGSVVSFTYLAGDPAYNHLQGAKSAFLYEYDYEIDDPMDNDERYMFDIGLKPLDDYSDQTEFDQEDRYLSSSRIGMGEEVTFYALWAKPVTDAVITLEPLECGTDLRARYRSNTWQADPAPVLTATGGIAFNDFDIIFSSWRIDGLESEGDETTVVGGTPCTATCFVSATWGYYLPDDFRDHITVVGGVLSDEKVYGLENGIAIETESVHVEGDDAVIVDATCTENGSKTYTCTECNEEVVEVIEATGHNWGDWVVVTPATVDEEGLEVRTCLNDPDHTESRIIPKQTPEVEESDVTETDPTETDPTVTDPTATDPTAADPATTDPATTDPTATDPAETDPTATDPATADPEASDPTEATTSAVDAVYTVSSGEDGEYVIGSDKDYTITIKRSGDDENCYSHFTGTVKIDDKELDDDEFTSEHGSTIIRLKHSMLDKLDKGEHKVTVVFDDGEVSVTVTVKEGQSDGGSRKSDSTVAATGESMDTVSFIGVTVSLSAAVIILAVALKPKKRINDN
ncbi:MAG: hypothetical protein IJ869_05005 [Clostridiales bacterium]|nr:hypothetical protein [Clostridiales bacterium]